MARSSATEPRDGNLDLDAACVVPWLCPVPAQGASLLHLPPLAHPWCSPVLAELSRRSTSAADRCSSAREPVLLLAPAQRLNPWHRCTLHHVCDSSGPAKELCDGTMPSQDCSVKMTQRPWVWCGVSICTWNRRAEVMMEKRKGRGSFRGLLRAWGLVRLPQGAVYDGGSAHRVFVRIKFRGGRRKKHVYYTEHRIYSQ